MTVYIEKPAVNLREELASLRNQGGYQEQQFYFDGLVTNGTFDAGTAGWADDNTASGAGSFSVVSGQGVVTTTTDYWWAYTTISTVVGKTYTVTFDLPNSQTAAFIGKSDSNNITGKTNTVLFVNGSASAGTITGTFAATATTTYIYFQNNSGTLTFDNVSVFETDGTDVVHRMPKGWKPKDVFEDGLLQREGAAHDYEVVYNGFDYFVKPTVAPSATTQTCVIGVKA